LLGIGIIGRRLAALSQARRKRPPASRAGAPCTAAEPVSAAPALGTKSPRFPRGFRRYNRPLRSIAALPSGALYYSRAAERNEGAAIPPAAAAPSSANRSPLGRSPCPAGLDFWPEPAERGNKSMSPDDRPPPDISLAVRDGARRLSYAELADVRKISRESAERLVRRRGWSRQLGNATATTRS
jgi:hypothetical protein